MAAPEISRGRCFRDSRNQHQDGVISLEEHLRDYTRHVSQHQRHEECSEVSSADVVREAQSDILQGAVMAAMLQGAGVAHSDVSQERLVEVLLGAESTALDGLRALDDSSDQTRQILAYSSLSQVILARALAVGNRILAKDIIHNVPPAHHHDLVFSPDVGDQPAHADFMSFDDREFCGHRMFRGQPDNGCDIWHAMIATGWATPRDYMHLDAATGPDETAAQRLFEILIEKGVRPDWRKVDMALAFGHSSVIRLYLDQFVADHGPLSHRAVHECYSIAAQKDDVELLSFLVQRAGGDVNGGVPTQPSLDAQREPSEQGPLQSTLHQAAESGSPRVVAWLLDRGAGAENARNSLGHTAYEAARHARVYLSERLDRNPNHPATCARLQQVMDILETRGLGPSGSSL